MPDDMLKIRPQDADKVNVHETHEVEFWTKKLGCTDSQLKGAVQAVGPSTAAVENYLRSHTTGLTSIHIQNFRAFRDIEIGPFSRINLIAGLNNAGKTGLLEAIFLLLQREESGSHGNRTLPTGLPNLFRVFSQQADVNENFWLWLFRDKRTDNEIRIAAVDYRGLEEKLILTKKSPQEVQKLDTTIHHISNLGPLHAYRPKDSKGGFPKPAIFSSHPSDPVQDAIDYNRVILKRAKKKVEALLKQVDPRLEGVEALQTGRSPLIYADIGLPEMIPVTHLGEGFCRLLDIYSELLAGEAKVLLIDELENGLHHSVLPVVWKGLIAAARELDVQIFATTHSAECIFAADQAARESGPYDLNLIRLDRVKDEIKATIVDKEAMETAREFDWELR